MHRFVLIYVGSARSNPKPARTLSRIPPGPVYSDFVLLSLLTTIEKLILQWSLAQPRDSRSGDRKNPRVYPTLVFYITPKVARNSLSSRVKKWCLWVLNMWRGKDTTGKQFAAVLQTGVSRSPSTMPSSYTAYLAA